MPCLCSVRDQGRSVSVPFGCRRARPLRQCSMRIESRILSPRFRPVFDESRNFLSFKHLTRAGDEIRTRDVQLGKLSLYH